ADLKAQLIILIDELQKHDIKIVLLQSLADIDINVVEKGIDLFASSADLDDSIDCLISLGGDGTILDSVTLVREKNIPILGINFGRLGFLAGIGKEELTLAVEALV